MSMESRDWRAALRDDLRRLDLPILGVSDREPSRVVGLHLAVFVEPYLKLTLEGAKTVESRFSSVRSAPFGMVGEGDVILLKRSGGSIVGVCKVDECLYFDPLSRPHREMASRFAETLCMAERVLRRRLQEARYVTLLRIRDVRPIESIKCRKRDRRGWVVLQSSV